MPRPLRAALAVPEFLRPLTTTGGEGVGIQLAWRSTRRRLANIMQGRGLLPTILPRALSTLQQNPLPSGALGSPTNAVWLPNPWYPRHPPTLPGGFLIPCRKGGLLRLAGVWQGWAASSSRCTEAQPSPGRGPRRGTSAHSWGAVWGLGCYWQGGLVQQPATCSGGHATLWGGCCGLGVAGQRNAGG